VKFLGAHENELPQRFALQFRGEIFNLLNRANFNAPSLIGFTSSASGARLSRTAGVITGISRTSHGFSLDRI